MTPRLTRDDVVEIVGRLDDLRTTEIIGTGASPAELVEARRWASGDQRTLPDTVPARVAIVAKVVDILRADEPDWDDR